MRLGTFGHFLASQDALGKMQFSGFCCSFPRVVYTVFSVTHANHAEKMRSKHQRLGRHKSFKPRILKSQLRDSRAKTGTFFAMEPKAFVCTSTWFEVINRAQCLTLFGKHMSACGSGRFAVVVPRFQTARWRTTHR